jgi:hypothetical protein
MHMVMQRSNTEVKWVQTEDALTFQENITGWPHGFGFQSCVRYAEIRRRGHMVQRVDERMEDESPS